MAKREEVVFQRHVIVTVPDDATKEDTLKAGVEMFNDLDPEDRRMNTQHVIAVNLCETNVPNGEVESYYQPSLFSH
jgi:hypothetical protein